MLASSPSSHGDAVRAHLLASSPSSQGDAVRATVGAHAAFLQVVGVICR